MKGSRSGGTSSDACTSRSPSFACLKSTSFSAFRASELMRGLFPPVVERETESAS
jgi:hypothetical protein